MHFLYLYISLAASQGLCLIGLFTIAVQISGKKHLPSHFLKICVQSTNIFKHRRIYKSIYVLCHRYNVKYDVFYAKVLQCPPLHSVDAGCLTVEQLGDKQQQQQPPSLTVDRRFLLVYIAADPSPGDVLHENRPGTDLNGQGKILWIICVTLFLFVCFYPSSHDCKMIRLVAHDTCNSTVEE